MADFILLDIEGTTSAIDFVHKTLFPYARARLPAFVAAHRDDAEVLAALADVRATLAAEQGCDNADEAQCIAALLAWIDQDRKHPALKVLQGRIWAGGFRSRAFTAHVYPDVEPAFRRWRALGKRLGIYSSGSVAAQQLYFAHTVAGDLTPLIEAYFDTRTGPKREADSYRAIAAQLELAPVQILFLSDVPAELQAAREAGCAVLHVCRPGTDPDPQFPCIAGFSEVDAYL